MILFDSHAHFPTDSAPLHRSHILQAQQAGLIGLLAVGGSPELDGGAIAMAREFPRFAYLALGYDRDTASAVASSPAVLSTSLATLRERIRVLANEGIPLRAIGEIGLDFSRDPSSSERSAQCALFEAQLALAAELGLPCSIHSRDAVDDTLAVIERSGSKTLRQENRLGVIHCFTGDDDFARAAVALGLLIGVSGIFTFRNADALRSTVSTLPHDRLLIETDCPYLTPAPMRGRPNEPAMVVHTATKLAEVLHKTAEDVAAHTTANARHLFGLDK